MICARTKGNGDTPSFLLWKRYVSTGYRARTSALMRRISPVPLVAGIAVAAGIVLDPSMTVLIVGAAVVCALGLVHSAAMPQFFLRVVSALLLCYVLMGKGIAYLGVSPLFIGDIVLGLGLIAGLLGGVLNRTTRSPISVLVLAYMTWGLLRTLPCIGTFGLIALRDAAIWIYGGYALLVSACLVKTGLWRRIPRFYAASIPWMLLWLPAGVALSQLGSSWLPYLPGASVPVVFLKPGDVAVHLAGIASFFLLNVEGSRRRRSSLGTLGSVALWSATFLIVASKNRGGMLAVFSALFVTFWLGKSRRWLPASFAAFTLATLLAAVDFKVDLGGSRVVSPGQVFTNALSVIGMDGGETLSGSRKWRLDWWNTIMGYTFGGEFFWTGKGFGINLANDDGFQSSSDATLRSPHNGHLTVLARAGVPGFFLWIVSQGSLAVLLTLRALRARRDGDPRLAAFQAWILAYWVAFIVNAGFDVVLEGPHGGIWFWCVAGTGIALCEVGRVKSQGVTVRGAMKRPPEPVGVTVTPIGSV